MSGHRVTWYHDQDVVVGEVVCDEPEGAPCRLICEARCEQWVSEGHEHPLASSPCNLREWLMEVPLAENYAGKNGAPVRNGEVLIEWNGDFYTWRYTEEAS